MLLRKHTRFYYFLLIIRKVVTEIVFIAMYRFREIIRMSKLLILCVDGLDPDFASDNGFSLPYERRLEIPKELYLDGIPWTLSVWPSIFSGKIEAYPNPSLWPSIFSGKMGVFPNPKPVKITFKKRIREWLWAHGIKWYRSGLRISFSKPKEPPKPPNPPKPPDPTKWVLIPIKPIVEETVLDNYNSLTYHIPAVSCDYIYGGDDPYEMQEWQQFNLLVMYLTSLNFDIAAIYCRIIDHKGHLYIEGNEASLNKLLHLYREVFYLAETVAKSGDVILVSDHGTIGDHTESAYIGSTRPLKAKSVLDVRADIESILNK